MSFLSGTEEWTVAAWLDATLKADNALMAAATGGVWDGPPPEASAYPIVRYGMLSAVVVGTAAGPGEVMVNSLWLVRGIIPGASYLPLKTIAQRIHALLQGSTIVVTSEGTIESCVREEAFQQAIVEGGKEYRHLGGIYRIYVQ